jgi:CHAT domain-containing protein
VGRVFPGEGVLGIRRAFEVAGAGTLIMSPWPVEDDATRVWMKALYEVRTSGRSTADAVREGNLRLIRDQRERGRSTHHFWGAFVAAGDWR